MIVEQLQVQKQSSEQSESSEQKQKNVSNNKRNSFKCIKQERIYQIILSICIVFLFGLLGNQYINISQYYRLDLTPRVQLQQPRIQQFQLKVWKIINNDQINTQINNCVLVNAVNSVTKVTINSVNSIIKQKEIGVLYLVIDKHDIKGNQIINRNIQIRKEQVLITFDSDYSFVKSIKTQCKKLGYLFGNFDVNQQMADRLKQQFEELDSSSLFYSSRYRTTQNRAHILEDLSEVDLSQLNPQSFYNYLYILNTEFLSLVSPLNFVFYAKYTLEQMILLPILVIYQSSGKMVTNKKILYTLDKSSIFIRFKQFSLQAPKAQNNSLCFVSYPNDPYSIDEALFQNYLNSVVKQSKNKLNKQNISISSVIYLPYKFNQAAQLHKVTMLLQNITKQNPDLRVRLRVCSQKAVSSYAVYDSVYTYCPARSLIISSRHNIIYKDDMSKQLLGSLSQKYHYYFFDLQYQNKKVQRFYYKSFYQSNKQLKWSIFQEKAHYVQVFKSDLMKTGSFWLLKSAEVDFYQTEEVFFVHMMQMVRENYGYIDKALAKVTKRAFNQAEIGQIKAIKTYGQYYQLVYNILMPYQYNCLQNPVYRRNAPFKMSANIHQIWIGNGAISSIRQKLRSTLVQKNPNFKVYLWTVHNVTRSQAPLSFYLVQRTLTRHKEHQKSLYAMAADLLRLELLVSYGGIYIDFKYEGLKPLDNFLKYEVLFTDCDLGTIRYGIPKAVGNPIIGSVQNNYHLKIVLTELIYQENFDFGKDFSIPFVTGSFVLRRSITQKQLFTQVGFGYHLFIPEPYEKIVNLCGGPNKQFDSDQEVFEVDYIQSDQPIKLGIPCKQYPQAYIVDYSPLGRTWIFNKKL